MSTGIIILAAGNSSRLGKPKQLLEYRGKTLLEIVTQTATSSAFSPIVTVIGAYAEEIINAYQHPNVTYIVNDSWQRGISSSIAVGVMEILTLEPTIENIIITVADQVFLTPTLLNNLVTKQQKTGKNIIASTYVKTTGTPVLFNNYYFDDLLVLEGNTGAKHLLKKYADDVATITFDLGHVDIDTQTDYNNLIYQK